MSNYPDDFKGTNMDARDDEFAEPTHKEQLKNIVVMLDNNHYGTKWMTKRGYESSLQALNYAKELLAKCEE